MKTITLTATEVEIEILRDVAQNYVFELQKDGHAECAESLVLNRLIGSLANAD